MNDDEVKRRMLADSAGPGFYIEPPTYSGEPAGAASEGEMLRSRLLGSAGERETNEQRFLKFIDKIANQGDAAMQAERPRAAAALDEARRADAMRSAGDLALAAGQAFVGNQGGASQAAGFSRATPETERAERANKEFQAWLGKRYDAGDLGSRFTQAMGQDIAEANSRRDAVAAALVDQRMRETGEREAVRRAGESDREFELRKAEQAQRERQDLRQFALGKRRIDIDEAYKRDVIDVKKQNAEAYLEKIRKTGSPAITGRALPAEQAANLAKLKAAAAYFESRFDDFEAGRKDEGRIDRAFQFLGKFMPDVIETMASVDKRAFALGDVSSAKAILGDALSESERETLLSSLPVAGDSPELRAKKREAVRAFISGRLAAMESGLSQSGYQGAGQPAAPAATQPARVPQGMTKVRRADGKPFAVPSERVEEYLKKNPGSEVIQ